MTNEQLGVLFEAFTHYYWSVPLHYVIKRILEWHPEVTERQIAGVVKKCDKGKFWHYCSIEAEGLAEPELVADHLLTLGRKDLDQFLAARMDIPIYPCDEETLLKFNSTLPDIPEVRAILEFGSGELGLDDEWNNQLVKHCLFCQPRAFYEGRSWVEGVVNHQIIGKIRFETQEQLERLRELGNALYWVCPNPITRGWKPSEVENAPILLDDLPEIEKVINDKKEWDKITASLREIFKDREGLEDEEYFQRLSEDAMKKTPKPNDPCPCGSGKKYKKCCGRK